MIKKVESQIKKLEKIANEILRLKKESRPRRPIVIEICGSPKSGKSSCVSSLNIFLKRNGFNTKVLTERASVCPITDKFDPLFNIWTSCSVIVELSEYIANFSKDIDLIILDRGIFDAICWFDWLKNNNHLTNSDYNSLIQFLLMDKWRSIIDLIYVFKSSPEVSLNREYATLLTRKHGTIMNPSVLKNYIISIKNACKNYEGKFRSIREIDTSETLQNDVSYNVTEDILTELKRLIIEQIGYINISELKQYEKAKQWYFNEMDIPIKLNFGRRDEVEIDEGKIQPVAIVTITDEDKSNVLLLKKNLSSVGVNSPEKDKLLIYSGGHIRKEDNIHGKNESFISICKMSIIREIKEELGLSISPQDENPLFIWDKTHIRSKHHLAVCFTFQTDLKQLEVKLDQYEFIQKTGKTKSGRIQPIRQILNENFEEWSKIILKNIYGYSMPDQIKIDI